MRLLTVLYEGTQAVTVIIKATVCSIL